MELTIHKPSYYSKYNSVDSDVERVCRKIEDYVIDKEYSEIIKHVDILPVVAPDEVLAQGLWEEDIMYSKSIGRISIFKHVDYVAYIEGDTKQKIALTVACLLDALSDIHGKRSIRFDYDQFYKDINALLNDSSNASMDYSVEVNDQSKFTNRVVSDFLVNEVLNYLIRLSKTTPYEHMIISNEQTGTFMQTYYKDGYFTIQFVQESEDGHKYLMELCNKKKKETFNVFSKFIKGAPIDIKYLDEAKIVELKRATG